MNIYQLCFVKDNVLYFTDAFDKQSGDNWDSEWSYSAGIPYSVTDDKLSADQLSRAGNIIKLGTDLTAHNAVFPRPHHRISWINNKKEHPWIVVPSYERDRPVVMLYAGTSLNEVLEKLKDTDVAVGFLDIGKTTDMKYTGEI